VTKTTVKVKGKGKDKQLLDDICGVAALPTDEQFLASLLDRSKALAANPTLQKLVKLQLRAAATHIGKAMAYIAEGTANAAS
jgi:hypothetical protein